MASQSSIVWTQSRFVQGLTGQLTPQCLFAVGVLLNLNEGGGVWTCFLKEKLKRTCGINLRSLSATDNLNNYEYYIKK